MTPRLPSEFDLQRAICIWLDTALLPNVLYWHTPNGGTRTSGFEGKRLKQIGVKAGVHDLVFLYGGLYGLELKAPGKYRTPEAGLSQAQRNFHRDALAAGMVASATADDLETARQVVRSWGLVREGC